MFVAEDLVRNKISVLPSSENERLMCKIVIYHIVCLFAKKSGCLQHAKMFFLNLYFYFICSQLLTVESGLISHHLNKEVSSYATFKHWHAYTILHSQHTSTFFYEIKRPRNLIAGYQVTAKLVSTYTKVNKLSGGMVGGKKLFGSEGDGKVSNFICFV